MLASEYGWSKRDILSNVFPDELSVLADEIARRRQDRYLEQLGLQTVTDPMMDPTAKRELLENINEQRRALYEGEEVPELDIEGFEALRAQIQKESRAIRAKGDTISTSG